MIDSRSHSRHLAPILLRLVFTLVLIYPPLAFAQNYRTDTDADGSSAGADLAALEQSLEQILEQTNTPGLIAAVVDGDQTIWTGALGLADRASGRAVTSSSRFRIGSITKSFTSLTALVLAEQGLLTLDMELAPLIPEAGIDNRWRQTDPVRLFHTLEHTAGFDDIHLHEYAFSDPTISLLDAIQLNTTSRIVRWRPGTRMSYSNIGPAIAALAMATVTGERFEDLAQQHVLDVLNLQHTGYFHHPDVVSSYRADGQTPEPYMHIADRPSGSMHSTAGDMAQLLRMYLGRGRIDDNTVVISSVSLDRMEKPHSTLAAKAGLVAGYGLSNSGNERNGFWYQGHGGGIDGFLSNYAYSPAINRGYFFAINASNGEAVREIDSTLRSFVTRDLQTPPQTPYLSGVNLSAMNGYFQPDAPRQEILRWLELITGTVAITSADDTLVITPMFGSRSLWRPLSEQLLRSKDGIAPTLAYVTSTDGELLLQGPSVGTLKKIPSWLAWTRLVLITLSLLVVFSSLLFASVWLPRRLLVGTEFPLISVRAWPVCASLTLVSSFVLLQLGQNVAVPRLATMTLYSMGFWLLSWAFAFASLVSTYNLISRRTERHQMDSIVWWHSLLVTMGNLLLLTYLASYGVIGLQTWSY